MVKITIVDDDPVVRLLLGESLSALGYDVSVAEDGGSGLTTIERESPDLIFCDLMMPDMNGFDLIKNIRSSASIKKVPIVLLSANDDRSVLNSAGGNLPDKMLSKPWQTKDLVDTLKELLPEG